MKALVLQAKGRLVSADVDAPGQELAPDDLLVRTKAATICTSDLADIEHNAFNIKLPMVMGHECAGIVAGIGENVTAFKRGDRVAVHPFMQCNRCDSCIRGLGHLCDDIEHLGITRGGGFAEYFTIRQDKARIIPDGVGFPEATLMEPVSVCLEGIERAGVGEGKNVLIVGDGPFGILMSKLCVLYKPARVILLGRHPFRMSYAANAVTINEKESDNIQDDIRNATIGGAGIDCAILCAAAPDAVGISIEALRARGTLSVFSALPGKTPVDLFKLHVKELNICGSCNDPDYMDKAMTHITNNTGNINQIITHKLPFAQWEEAFHLAAKERDKALKVTMLFE